MEINFAKNIFGNLNNDPRLKGTSLSAKNDTTIIKNGIFTSCKKNDNCPPWSLQSSEIKHDKTKKTINYKNAWLRIYDKPIFYFPKFFHPDPTVERQSGFLVPALQESSSLGTSLTMPYFYAISENKDSTFTPRFFSNERFILQNEYREVQKDSSHTVDLSILEDKKNKTHLFTKGIKKINFFT